MASSGHQSPFLHHTPSPNRTLSPVIHLEDKTDLGEATNQATSYGSVTEADRDCWSPSQHHQPQRKLVMNLNIPQNKCIDGQQSGGGRARGRGRGRGRHGQGTEGQKRVTGLGIRRGQVGQGYGGRGGAVNAMGRLEAPRQVNNPLDDQDHNNDVNPPGDGDGRVRIGEPPVHQYNCACCLVPACVTAEPSRRRCCYGACIGWAFISVILLTAVVATITVWEVEGYRNTTLSISTNETFKLSDVYSNNHLFSRKLCLGPITPPTSSMSLFLTRTRCHDFLIGNTTETIKGNYAIQKSASKKSSLMFFWLNGTFFELQANVTGNIIIYLLNDLEDYMRCSEDQPPAHSMAEINCSATIVPHTEAHTCYFNRTVNTSGHYYLCFHGPRKGHSAINLYTLNIYQQYYELPHNTPVKCNMSSDCCQSYGSLLDEIEQPTCIFVITNVTHSYDVGYRAQTSLKSVARLDLVWYGIGVLTLLLLLAAVCTVTCGSVVHKSRHPYVDVACNCHLYQRRHYEPIPPH